MAEHYMTRTEAEGFVARLSRVPTFIVEAVHGEIVRPDGAPLADEFIPSYAPVYKVRLSRTPDVEPEVQEGVKEYGNAQGMECLCRELGL